MRCDCVPYLPIGVTEFERDGRSLEQRWAKNLPCGGDGTSERGHCFGKGTDWIDEPRTAQIPVDIVLGFRRKYGHPQVALFISVDAFHFEELLTEATPLYTDGVK